MNYSFVLIPENLSQAPEECTGNDTGGLEKDDLQIFAKKHLHRDGYQNNSLQGIMNQLQQQGHDISKLDPSILQSVLNMGTSLEIISLQLPSKKNNFIGVSLYADANAQSKNFGFNERASEIARSCGHSNISVYGDAFIGRYFDDENTDWKRRNFVLSEAQSNAEWVKQCQLENSGKNMNKYSTSGTVSNILNNSTQSTSETSSRFVISQTDSEVDIQLVVDQSISAKQVNVIFKPTNVRVVLPAINNSLDNETEKSLVSNTGLELYSRVLVDDCSWYFDNKKDQKILHITLFKSKSENWPQYQSI